MWPCGLSVTEAGILVCRLQAQAGRAVRALRLDALLTIVMHLDSLVSKGRWQGEASTGA